MDYSSFSSTNLRDSKILYFRDVISSKIKDSFNNSYFNSKIIQEYYFEVIFPQMKDGLRGGLKLMLVFWYGSTYINFLFQRANTVFIVISMLSLAGFMGIYVSTVFMTTTKSIFKAASCSMLLLYFSSILNLCNGFSLVETTFTPIVQTVLLMFSLMPIEINNAIVLSSLSFSMIIILSSMNIQRKEVLDRFARLVFNDPQTAHSVSHPLRDDHIDIYRDILAIIVLGVSLGFVSLYLSVCHTIRQRTAFLRLGNKIKAKKQTKAEVKVQLKWMDTIMPSVVKDEYFRNLDLIKDDKWLYVKAFDNVTILFADIVEFSDFGASKTASQVVMLLNDLFNRFDEIASLTNCEKLGTFGGCYYCVAGCPVPRSDHAICCVELGLGIFRILRKFNSDYSEDLVMRIGIHTGRVNAAIIGKQRCRFDVYSNDVITAHALESKGKPGEVHISQSTHDLIRMTYTVKPGDDLEIKREEDHGIAGLQLKSAFIKTYYLEKNSSLLTQGNKTLKINKLRVMQSQRQTSMSFQEDLSKKVNDDVSDGYPKPLSKEEYRARINADVAFVEGLKFDPDSQTDLFFDPPLHSILMKFKDAEMEWHFSNKLFDTDDDLSLDSLQVAPFFDCLICFLYSLSLYTAALILFPELRTHGWIILGINLLLSLCLVIIILWHCVAYESRIENRALLSIHKFFSTFIMRSLLCIHFISSPTISLVLLLYDCAKIFNLYSFTIKYFIISFFSLFITPLYFSTHYFLKNTICIINVTLVFVTLTLNPCLTIPLLATFPHFSCQGRLNITDVSFFNMLRVNFGFQIVITLILILILIRVIERNLRIWFFVSREANISREEAIRIIKKSKEMLYNIIPKYVFQELQFQYSNKPEVTNFNYALEVPNSGVLFACISNFFSQYYREDYKGGENALKLLHKIIGSFDNVMQKHCYKDVEKIKTINDCYMVASGLNIRATEKNVDKKAHLKSLLHYGFDLIKTLTHFNENYIIGSDKFEIKIGFNFGPVTAGIIGSKRPIYDIWGDTVNMASLMYSTGVPGKIQVPQMVCAHLQDSFNFKYKGEIFVKGKGNMKTFICALKGTKGSPGNRNLSTYFSKFSNVPNFVDNLIMIPGENSLSSDSKPVLKAKDNNEFINISKKSLLKTKNLEVVRNVNPLKLKTMINKKKDLKSSSIDTSSKKRRSDKLGHSFK